MRVETNSNFLGARMSGPMVQVSQVPALVPIVGMTQADWDKLPLNGKRNLMTAMNLKGMTESTIAQINTAVAEKVAIEKKSKLPLILVGIGSALLLYVIFRRPSKRK